MIKEEGYQHFLLFLVLATTTNIQGTECSFSIPNRKAYRVHLQTAPKENIYRVL